MLECRILTQPVDLEAIKGDWEGLHKRIRGNVFASYGFCQKWWEHIGVNRGATLHIATGWREGVLVALLPFVTYKKCKLRLLRWMADSIFFTCLDLADDENDIKELWHYTREHGFFDFAEIKAIVPGTIVHDCVIATPRSKCADVGIERAVVFDRLDKKDWGDPCDYTKGPRRHQRKKLGKIGETTLVTYENIISEDVFQNIIRHKLKWCESVGLDGPSFGSAAFLLDLMGAAKEQRALNISCLNCGPVQIAYMICFYSHDTLYGYMIANDAEWNKYSPGILIHIHAIIWAAERGFKEFNFMEGFYDFKKEFGNHHRDHLTYVFFRNGKGAMGALLYLILNNVWVKKVWRMLKRDKGYRAHEKKG